MHLFKPKMSEFVINLTFQAELMDFRAILVTLVPAYLVIREFPGMRSAPGNGNGRKKSGIPGITTLFDSKFLKMTQKRALSWIPIQWYPLDASI